MPTIRLRTLVVSLSTCVAVVVAGTLPAATAAPPARGLAACVDDPAFRCATIPVPLNRQHPDSRTIPLHVEVFPHTGPAAAPAGAVFITLGGPGASISAFDKYPYADMLSTVAETRDLVFVDQRGLGLSAAIDCPAWQHGGPFYPSAAQCHDQLGDTANFYSTTDVADDLEQVRRTLGYGDIDLIGASYATLDMVTYATRWKQNVRSISLGAPGLAVDTDPFNPYPARAYPTLVNAVCGRSPGCAAANRDPAGSLAWLADRLRRTPVTGTGYDSHGIAHKLTVTENLLAFGIMFFNGGSFVGPGEITPAAEALRRGDAVPLLRLAADVDPANGFDSGDPREYSAGHALARMCVDLPVQWDKDASPARRAQQYAAAYAAEPAHYGPISKAAWDHPGYLGYSPQPCIASSWQDRPNYPSGTKVRGIPSLILAGEYDAGVPEELARIAGKVLVGSKYVELAAVGHATWFEGPCGTALLQRFITTLNVGDTSCARVPPAGYWMPGSFPVTAASAPVAKQTSGPAASPDVRRLATVTTWTVLDGLSHIASISGLVAGGLRGGTITYVPDADVPFVFDDARFTKDVRVSGSTTWTPDGIEGSFTVRTSSGPPIQATLTGPFTKLGSDLTLTLRQGPTTQTLTLPGY
ncbi:alpha/beta fold hydrolase [Kribbella sp. NPDC051952]|uniref:alpha/beta fold hydrolase n=1 Tax=Kribbella sp. NPDC051952 TaxID=3154851 RepID=UPI0034405955